jgi:cytochrome c556
VHLPIGYDGVPAPTIAALDKLLHEDSGHILVHCHHGKHRGPAAAAITCMIEGSMTKAGALHVLEQAGTSHDYEGLWRDVRNFSSVPRNVVPAPLKPRSDVEPFAADMVGIDHSFEALTKLTSAQPVPKKKASENATLLLEGFTEALRHTPGKHEDQKDFRAALTHAKGKAGTIAAEIKAGDFTAVSGRIATLKADCRQCHHKFRD